MEKADKNQIKIFNRLQGKLSLRTAAIILIASAILYGASLLTRYSFLLFHTLIEVITIAVGYGVFLLAWNLQRISKNNYLIFLGIAFFSFSTLDLVHTLTYEGMDIIQGYDANLTTQFWIAARYLQSISFFVAPLFLRRKVKLHRIVFIYVVVVALLIASIFARVFPICYIEGVGLTPFKIISEYVISLIFIGAIFEVKINRQRFDEKIYHWLIISILLSICSELAFTFYVGVYGFFNFIGHIFKLFAYFFIYKAIIETGLNQPVDLLFQEIEENAEIIRNKERAAEILGKRVAERTIELNRANENLNSELTERKKILRQLEENERRLRTYFESSPTAVTMSDAEGNYVDVNEFFCRMTGYSKEDVIGRKTADFTYPDDRDQFHERRLKMKSIQETILPLEKRIISKNGDMIWVAGNTILLRDENGQPTHYMSNLIDISDIKQAEKTISDLNENLEKKIEERTKELKDAQEQLLRQERLAVLGRLAGSVSHELRNPLAVISNYTQILQMKLSEKNKEAKEYLEVIRDETRRSEKIISDLLDFSRRKSSDPKPLKVNEIISESIHRTEVPSEIKLDLGGIQNDLMIYADPMHVSQILENIITNAIQAMPDGGCLTILSFLEDDGYIGVEIRDTGCGMADDVQEKIFEPLFTTKPMGFGLGLPLTKNLVELNHGRIEVKSKPGKGTSFFVFLPVYKNHD